MQINSLSLHTQFQGMSGASYSECSPLQSWLSAGLPGEWYLSRHGSSALSIGERKTSWRGAL